MTKHALQKRGAISGLPGFLIPTVLLLLADQGTKRAAYLFLRGHSSVSVIPGVFELLYLENTGAAFGILKQKQLFLVLLAVCIVLLTGWFSVWKLPAGKRYFPLRAACSMLCAGAIGNMLDRCIHGFVIDFLYFSLIDFPVFNVADIYVCVSCVLLVLLLLFYYREEEMASW